MKRLFFIAAMAVLINLSACADRKQVITFPQLPAPAQAVIKANFTAENIAYIMEERDWTTEYEVRFNDGVELEFDSDGEVKKVDCKYNPVPEALLPKEVVEYVKATCPNTFVKEWGRDDWGYKAELNNGLELKFSRSYKFLGVDD